MENNVNMKFETFLPEYSTYSTKQCCKEFDGGILIKDNVPHCRWCRTPYTKSGDIMYKEEHFNKKDVDNIDIFSNFKSKSDFECLVIANSYIKELKKEILFLKNLSDELNYKVKELKNQISTKVFSAEFNKLDEETKLKLKREYYQRELLKNIASLEKKCRDLKIKYKDY